MTDHRVRTIRFWLLSIAPCTLALWNPWWLCWVAWLPLALFMPVFAAACAHCTTQPGTGFQIVMVGCVDAAGSNCTSINDTFITTPTDPTVGGTCQWRFEFDSGDRPLCPAPGDYLQYVYVRVGNSGGQFINAQNIFKTGSGDDTWGPVFIPAGSTDCAAYSGIDMGASSPVGSCCDCSAVNPVVTAV